MSEDENKKTVDNTSDERTVNDVTLHAYLVLNDDVKKQIQDLNDKGIEFYNLLHQIGGTDPSGECLGSRELSLAGTKIEEAIMWAVKHITR